MNDHNLKIPNDKKFIFTIFDDTDVSTLENIRPVYDYLTELKIFTTKSVWPLESSQSTSNYKGSHSLQNREYASYIRELAGRGFEIAFHGASMESNSRELTIESLKRFQEILGFNPRTYASHAGNLENIYWGEHRFNFAAFRFLYRLLNSRKGSKYSGQNPESKYYWADICRDSFDYVRTFTFNDINLLNVGKFPYHVRDRACFKSCFYTSFADHVEEFNRLLSVENQARLARERGVCIVTTHFGKGFVKDGVLNPQTKYLLEQLVVNNGHFAPVSQILDYLRGLWGKNTIKPLDLFLLESRWFVDTIRRKLDRLEYEKTELKYLGLR